MASPTPLSSVSELLALASEVPELLEQGARRPLATSDDQGTAEPNQDLERSGSAEEAVAPQDPPALPVATSQGVPMHARSHVPVPRQLTRVVLSAPDAQGLIWRAEQWTYGEIPVEPSEPPESVSDPVEPDPNDTPQPDAEQPAAEQSETEQPQSDQSDQNQPDHNQSDSDQSGTDQSGTDPISSDASSTDSLDTDQTEADQTQSEPIEDDQIQDQSTQDEPIQNELIQDELTQNDRTEATSADSVPPSDDSSDFAQPDARADSEPVEAQQADADPEEPQPSDPQQLDPDQPSSLEPEHGQGLLFPTHWPTEAMPTSSLWSVVVLNDAESLELARFTDVDISLFEERFAEDLNGDGEITPRAQDRVLDDGSQGDGVGLQLSGEGILSLTTAEATLPLYALGVQSSAADGLSESYVAAAASDLGGYWLAYRYALYRWDETDFSLVPAAGWSVRLIRSDGQIDWTTSFWDIDIRRFEERFGQDLNGDGEITPRVPELVLDDGSQADGVGLKLSGEGLLSLTTADASWPLYSLGVQPVAQSGEMADSGLAYVAAAATGFGGYWLASRSLVNRWDPATTDLNLEPTTSWSLQLVGENGSLDGSVFLWDVDIRRFEERFAQDLNGDGEITALPAAVVLDDGSQADSVGLQISGEGILTLTTPEQSLPLYQLGSQDNSIISYLAAAAAAGGGYWLARSWQEKTIREEQDAPDVITRWSVQRFDAAGHVDWGMEFLNGDISLWETTFGQDLDGDGQITARPAPLVFDDGSQADGVGLQLSGEGILTITQADRELPLYSLGFPARSDAEAYVAAAAAESGGYWLAKSSPTWTWDESGEQMINTGTSWAVLQVDASGRYEWYSSFFVQDIGSWEDVFGQDLDGDQLINPNAATPEKGHWLWSPYYPVYHHGNAFARDTITTRDYVTMPFEKEGGILDQADGIALQDRTELTIATPELTVAPPPENHSKLIRMLDTVLSLEQLESAQSVGGGLMFGKRGDDSMIGSKDNDRIIGARNRATAYGRDLIRSGAGHDQIILGGTEKSFYDASGDRDYARIRSFNLNKDRLVLRGPIESYSVEAAIVVDGKRGDGLYDRSGDLIALIQTRDGSPFSLDSTSVISM